MLPISLKRPYPTKASSWARAAESFPSNARERAPGGVRRRVWALIVLLLLGGPAFGESGGPATPGFGGTVFRQPETVEERRRVVEEHYRLYGDAVDPDGERLRVEVVTYRELLPQSFHELETVDLASIDPRGTVALSVSHQLDRGSYRTTLRPELRRIPPQDLADWQQRRAAETTDLESGILQPIADSISEIWGFPTLPVAVGLMDVQVDLDGERLRYSAAATWFRDPSSSAVYYFILDLTLARIEDLDEIVTAVSEAPVEDRSMGESYAEVASGAEKSSDLKCRVSKPPAFIYPDGPSGPASAGGWNDWLSFDSVVHGSDRITQLDYFGHWTGGHSAWVIPSLKCTCSEGCDSSAALDLSLSQTQEDGFLTQYAEGCHKTVLLPGFTPKKVHTIHGGAGAWGNGAVVWGFRVCSILSGYCNPLCSNITINVDLDGGVSGDAGIVDAEGNLAGGLKTTITPDDGAKTLTIPIAAQCPPCVKLFEIKGEARGLAEQEVVKATATWQLDSEQGSQQQEKTQLGPDGRVVEFHFLERVPDGSAVRVDASVDGPGGEKVRDCYSIEGDVRGETLVLGLDCSCRPDSQKSTGCSSGNPVSGALELDASVQSPDMPPQAIGGVEVRLTATPPAGTPDPQPIVQTVGPFSVAAGSAATFPLQFPNPVPTGYSWEVRAISPGAPVVCPGTSSGVANGPVVASASCKTTRPLSTYSNDPLLDSFDICQLTTKTCEAVDGVEFPWFYPDFEFPERVCEWVPEITEEETTGCWKDDEGVEQCGNITIITVTERLVCHDVHQNTATAHVSPVLSVRASHREGSDTIVPQGEALHISGTSSDPDGVQPLIAFLNGSPLPPGTFTEVAGSFEGSLDTSTLGEGVHELALISVDDAAFNPVPAVARVGFRVTAPGTCPGDTSGPQLSFTPPDGAVVDSGSPVRIDISASDPSGIDRVRIFVDGQAEALLPGGAGPWHHEWDAGNGEHELLVRAFDTCDNSADLRHTVRGCSGPQPPEVSLTTPAAGAELIEGETVSLSAAASDDAGVDRVVFLDQSGAELGRDTTAPYNVSWTATAGTSQIKARAYDTCTLATTDVISVSVAPPAQPAEIQVSFGNNVLTQGETLDFGVFTVDEATKNRGITVTNLAPAGADELHVSQIQVIDTVGSAFSWGGSVVPLAGGASDNFALRFSIAEVGSFEAEVRIWHDAPGIANPRTFLARVEVEDHPRLRLRRQDGTSLEPGAGLAWGTLDHGSENNAWGGWRHVSVARNHSPAGPLVMSWQLVHSQGDGFSMGGNDLVPTLDAFREDAFVLRLDTTRPGSHQAQLRISHNDPSLPDPFVIHLSGTVRQAERLQVAHGSNVLEHGELKDFGTFVAGSGIKNRAITVSNLAPSGGSGLEWGPVQVNNTEGSAFFTGGTIVSPLAPGGSDDFTVRFDTATPGTYRATFEIRHSDPSTPDPHRFDVRMVVTPPPPVTVQFPAIADAYVDQTAPAINFGGMGQLAVRAATTGKGLSTYMKFDVSGIEGTLVSVKLRMRPVGSVGPTRLYRMVSTSWNESHITWQNAPLDFYFQRPTNATWSGGWLEMDVADMVGSNGRYTLGMTAEDVPGQAFHSRESGHAPVLVVTYQP